MTVNTAVHLKAQRPDRSGFLPLLLSVEVSRLFGPYRQLGCDAR